MKKNVIATSAVAATVSTWAVSGLVTQMVVGVNPWSHLPACLLLSLLVGLLSGAVFYVALVAFQRRFFPGFEDEGDTVPNSLFFKVFGGFLVIVFAFGAYGSYGEARARLASEEAARDATARATELTRQAVAVEKLKQEAEANRRAALTPEQRSAEDAKTAAQAEAKLQVEAAAVAHRKATELAEEAAILKAKTAALAGLIRTHDKMNGMSWYQHSTSPKHRNSNGVYLYFGRDDDGRFTDLRLVVQYAADDWLFVKRAWAKADGVTIEIPQESKSLLGWERDNGGGDIWEWSDVSLTSPAERSAVKSLAMAKDVTVRFEGRQYNNDKTLSAKQLKAMLDVIAAYENATGKPWK